jgi:hypothetical protein
MAAQQVWARNRRTSATAASRDGEQAPSTRNQQLPTNAMPPHPALLPLQALRGGAQPLAPEGPTPASQDAAAPDAAAGRDEPPQQQQPQQQAPATLRPCEQLQPLEAALGSPLPLSAQSFITITNDDTDMPASKRPRVAPLAVPQDQEEQRQVGCWGGRALSTRTRTRTRTPLPPPHQHPGSATLRAHSILRLAAPCTHGCMTAGDT